MNEIELFNNNPFGVEFQTQDDSFIVYADGLTEALGFHDTGTLLRSIPEHEKGYALAQTPGGDQRKGFVRESGFYRALGQRQPARIKDLGIRETVTRFQNWVYGELLPNYRKTGGHGPGPGEVLTLTSAVHELGTVASAVRDLVIEFRAERADQADVKASLSDVKADLTFLKAHVCDNTPTPPPVPLPVAAKMCKCGQPAMVMIPARVRKLFNAGWIVETWRCPENHTTWGERIEVWNPALAGFNA